MSAEHGIIPIGLRGGASRMPHLNDSPAAAGAEAVS